MGKGTVFGKLDRQKLVQGDIAGGNGIQGKQNKEFWLMEGSAKGGRMWGKRRISLTKKTWL